MAEPFVVRRDVQIAAPPATVFAFLTDPDKIVRWMGTEATAEPRLDGLYLVNVDGQRTEGRDNRDARDEDTLRNAWKQVLERDGPRVNICERLVGLVRNHVRAGRWRDAVRGALILLHYHPRAFAIHLGRKAYCVVTRRSGTVRIAT